MDTQQTSGAAGGAEVQAVALPPEEQAKIDVALKAEADAKAKAEADAIEAKRLEDEAAAKEMADRAAAMAQAKADDEDAKARPLRTDGPTLAEWVAEGYTPETYPPPGHAVVTEETRAAEHPDGMLARFLALEKRVAALEHKSKHFF